MVTAFRDGEVTLRTNRRTEGFTNAIAEHGYQGIRRGDLVVHSMDGFAGAIGVSDSDGKASPVVHAYQPLDGVDPRYYAYLLRDLALRGFVTSLARGIRERSTAFDSEALRSLVLPVPPPRVQRAIGDFLDAETARIDALVAKKRRLIELVDERNRSLRSKLVLHELDPVSGDGVVPDGWSNVSLSVCVQLQRGHDLPDQARAEGEVPIVSSGGISGWHEVAAAQPPGVVTGRYGTVGEVFYLDTPYWPLNTTLYVKDFRGCHPRWVFHLLASLPLDSESAKSAVTGINRNVIGRLRVPRPPLVTQVEIAERLDRDRLAVDQVSQSLSRQVLLLAERRQALITAAVTGELAVPGAA